MSAAPPPVGQPCRDRGRRDGRHGSVRDHARSAGAVLLGALGGLFADKKTHWAAAIAYYSLLSLFPALLIAVSLAAAFVDPLWAVEQATSLLRAFAPTGAGRVEAILRQAVARRAGVSLLSGLALLWTGSRVVDALTHALNLAYGVEAAYGFLKGLLVKLAVLLTVGLVFVLALSAELLIDLLRGVLGVLPTGRELVLEVVKETISPCLLLIAFFLIYRFVPQRRTDWRAALVSAGAATLLFLASRALFLAYLDRFGQYELIYGPSAIVVVLMLWIWIVALLTIFGGELAARIERHYLDGHAAAAAPRRDDEAAGRRPPSPPPEPVGERRGSAGRRKPLVALLTAGGVLLVSGAMLSRALHRSNGSHSNHRGGRAGSRPAPPGPFRC